MLHPGVNAQGSIVKDCINRLMDICLIRSDETRAYSDDAIRPSPVAAGGSPIRARSPGGRRPAPDRAVGWSRRRCAPRDSRRSSAAARDQAGQRDTDRRAARAGRGSSRLGPGEPPDGPAGRDRRRLEPEVGGAGGLPALLGPRPPRGGARAEDEALAERVRGQAVGAVEARARALADGVAVPGRVERPSRSVAIPPIR